jgi:hypothetical protein
MPITVLYTLYENYCYSVQLNLAKSLTFRLLNQPSARILKHFEMTAGLKVRVQGFQICLQIFSIENVDVHSLRLVQIWFYIFK